MNLSLILSRLKRLEKQFLESNKLNKNISYVMTNDINSIRITLINEGPSEVAKYASQSTRPLETSNGSPPYPSRPDAAVHLVHQLIDIVQSTITTNDEAKVAPNAVTVRSVFIVHGHDELNLLRLKNILRERFEITSIVLSEQASEGRTIIEKFEAVASGVPFCIALLTPDDEVSNGEVKIVQARPNVTFELGWFYGRLGRSRVCIICRKGTHIHSDLNGIMRIEFINKIDETVIDLERESSRAGIFVQR